MFLLHIKQNFGEFWPCLQPCLATADQLGLATLLLGPVFIFVRVEQLDHVEKRQSVDTEMYFYFAES